MSLTLFSVFILLIQLSNGVPLSTTNLSQYFPRIVGGEEVPEGATPYMAALVISEYLTMLVCGASIVTSKHLLTAAHCIDVFIIRGELLKSYHAKVGTNDWYHNGTDARILRFYIHPDWDHQHIKNDVAILELQEFLKLRDKMVAIPLYFNHVGGGEKSQVTGWGRLQAWGINPFKLQTLSVTTLSHEQCLKDLLSSTVGDNIPHTLHADVEICTFHSINHGNCHGDSGGPLVVSGLQQQVGVVSWAVGCARGLPDVYVRLSGFKNFILPIIKGYL